MAHPLYSKCLGHVNKPVTLHHVNGNDYHGILSGVNPQGVYLSPVGQVAHNKSEGLQAQTAESHEESNPGAEQVFFAPFFFPFGLLTGFTIGLAAGALAYPRYPYGPYWW